MKIDSIMFFDAFDQPVCKPVPSVLYDMDDTINRLAEFIHSVFEMVDACSAIAWLNVGTRYILVRKDSYTVVYTSKFNKLFT